MTLNGIMAVILRYFTEFGSFRGPLRKSGWRYPDIFCDKMSPKLSILFLATYQWWRYSRRLLRTGAILLDHRVGTFIGRKHLHNITILTFSALLSISTASLILSWWNLRKLPPSPACCVIFVVFVTLPEHNLNY